MRHERHTVQIRVTLATGEVYQGPIQGNGGKLGSGALHAGHELAEQETRRRLEAAQRLAADGRDTGLFEPTPGHLAIYPGCNEATDGEHIAVPIAGSTFEVLKETGAVTSRYAAYCRAHGNTPETQKAADVVRWPGGQMTGFTIWMQARWRDWRRWKGYGPDHPVGREGHAEFDVWLQKLVNKEARNAHV